MTADRLNYEVRSIKLPLKQSTSSHILLLQQLCVLLGDVLHNEGKKFLKYSYLL